MKLIEKGLMKPEDVPRQFFTFVANAEEIRRYDIHIARMKFPFFFDDTKDIEPKEALHYLSLLFGVPENWHVVNGIESGGSWNPLFGVALQIMEYYGEMGLRVFFNDIESFIEVIDADE